MEIPAWCYISFWAIISFTFLHLGFLALDDTKISVFPAVMFLFKHSLAVSACFSSGYALVFRAQSERRVRSNFVLFFYVFVPAFSPQTTGGILIRLILSKLKIFFGMIIQHILFTLKIFFAMSMIMYLPSLVFRILFELKNFFDMIMWLPALVFHFLMKMWLVISIASIALLLYNFPLSEILSNTVSILLILIAKPESMLVIFIIKEYILLPTMFMWKPIIYFVCICCVFVFIFSCLALFIRACKNNFAELKTRSVVLLALEMSLIFVSDKKGNFNPVVALSVSHFIFVFLASAPKLEDNDTLFSIFGNPGRMLKEKKVMKFMEFAVVTMGAILFQHFFKITTFREVEAFLCFAVAWLANLVLLGYFGDLYWRMSWWDAPWGRSASMAAPGQHMDLFFFCLVYASNSNQFALIMERGNGWSFNFTGCCDYLLAQREEDSIYKFS